jgi:hypothetical protein
MMDTNSRQVSIIQNESLATTLGLLFLHHVVLMCNKLIITIRSTVLLLIFSRSNNVVTALPSAWKSDKIFDLSSAQNSSF